jgi:hypothetical protein
MVVFLLQIKIKKPIVSFQLLEFKTKIRNHLLLKLPYCRNVCLLVLDQINIIGVNLKLGWRRDHMVVGFRTTYAVFEIRR